MTIPTYVIAALVFVGAALMILALCDRGDPRKQDADGGYDSSGEGWSFGGPTEYDDSSIFTIDD
ncbi:MAG: hypothetical protein DCC68_07745 [Planctomycetota bacterium]|nr:MAG: hypothetical protein DCC68_07745 [Planctomycetota bacterium]